MEEVGHMSGMSLELYLALFLSALHPVCHYIDILLLIMFLWPKAWRQKVMTKKKIPLFRCFVMYFPITLKLESNTNSYDKFERDEY